jgi:hypothetical protein
LARFAARRRHRDQELVGLVVANDVGKVVRRAEDPHPVHAQVLLARVVVDQPIGV